MVYQSLNMAVLEQIPHGVRRVLDVGCGGGMMAARLKQERECEVTGITHSTVEAEQARQRLDCVVVADLNQLDPRPLGKFDCIVCSHVLEHLVEPEQLLVAFRSVLTPKGVLVVALPNVLFWKQRLQFMLGRFRYADGGLMDRTHLRFYDWESAERLVSGAGYEVRALLADGGFPLSGVLGKAMAGLIDRGALRRWPGLFGFQFVMRCHVAQVSDA